MDLLSSGTIREELLSVSLDALPDSHGSLSPVLGSKSLLGKVGLVSLDEVSEAG